MPFVRRLMMKVWVRAEADAEAAEVGPPHPPSPDGGWGGGEPEKEEKSFTLSLRGGISWKKMRGFICLQGYYGETQNACGVTMV
jgi:hypothetical protein